MAQPAVAGPDAAVATALLAWRCRPPPARMPPELAYAPLRGGFGVALRACAGLPRQLEVLTAAAEEQLEVNIYRQSPQIVPPIRALQRYVIIMVAQRSMGPAVNLAAEAAQNRCSMLTAAI